MVIIKTAFDATVQISDVVSVLMGLLCCLWVPVSVSTSKLISLNYVIKEIITIIILVFSVEWKPHIVTTVQRVYAKIVRKDKNLILYQEVVICSRTVIIAAHYA